MRRAKGVGLFIDLENILISTRNAYGCSPDFGKVVLLASKYGRIEEASGYADFCNVPHEIKIDLFLAGIRQINVPSWSNGSPDKKNCSDEVMAQDIYRLLHKKAKIETFILATGDTHILPALLEAKWHGKRIVVTAVPEETGHLLKKAADEFIPLVPEGRAPSMDKVRNGSGNRITEVDTALIEKIVALEKKFPYMVLGFAVDRLLEAGVGSTRDEVERKVKDFLRTGVLEEYDYPDPSSGLTKKAIRLSSYHRILASALSGN